MEMPAPATTMPTSASPATGRQGAEQRPGGAERRAAPQQRQLAHAAGEPWLPRRESAAAPANRAGRQRAEGGGGVEVGLEVHGAPALPRVLDEEGQRAQRAEDHEQARHRAQRGARRPPARPPAAGARSSTRGRGDDDEADEHEHGLGPAPAARRRAGREAAAHHAGREGAVGEAQHGPAAWRPRCARPRR